MMQILDRAATIGARRLASFLGRHVDESKREWVSALESEIEDLDSGWQRIRWAASGLPLLWSFRRRKAAVPLLAPAGSSIMNESAMSSPSKLRGSDILSIATSVCLTAVVVGYVVFILPVFQSMIGSTGQTLDLRGIDFAAVGTNTARIAGLVFLIGLAYVARRPAVNRPKPIAMVFGGVNVLLGASALLLGVTVIQFVILLIPAMQEAVRGRERVQLALYDLASIDAATSTKAPLTGVVLAEARFRALAKVVHQETFVSFSSVSGRVADSSSARLLAELPAYTKLAEYEPAAHDANLLAGMVALELRNDITRAKKYLAAAGRFAGAPNHTSMRLAQALLWRGERNSVLAYLEQRRGLTKDDGAQLDSWVSRIKEGEVNVFGPSPF